MPEAFLHPDERPAVSLHLGMGKTGTTTIQTWLHHNRERLVDLGVLYPASPGRKRHRRLSLSMQTEPRRSQDWDRSAESTPEEMRPVFVRELLQEVRAAGAPRLVLSDEALLGTPDAAISNLRRLLDGIASSVRVVVYLRRQDDHLCSRYQQVVKQGATTQRLSERADGMQHARLYDYEARLAGWASLLRPDDLVVRRFQPSSFSGGSLLQDFVEAAGLDIRVDDLEQPPTRNESVDAESVEFARLLNIVREQHEGPIPGMPRQGLITRRLQRASTGPALTLPEERLDRFMAGWEESNRAVARTYFPEGSEALFDAGRKSGNTTTVQWLDPDRVDHFVDVLRLPAELLAPLRRVAEREAFPA